MAKTSESREFVTVYSANGQLAGEMIRLLLESMNIPAILSQESVGTVYGLTVGPLGKVKIMVPASRAEEAAKILQEMAEGKLETLAYPKNFSAVPTYKNNKAKRDEILKEPED